MSIDPEMTAIYKSANGESNGKSYPITSEKIFKAMRLAGELAKSEKKPMTEEQIKEMSDEMYFFTTFDVARAVEAFHGIIAKESP